MAQIANAVNEEAPQKRLTQDSQIFIISYHDQIF